MRISLQDRVAIRTPNWLGDAIISMPAVRNLKQFIGRRPLTIVTPEKLADLWKAAPFVDEVIALPQPRKFLSSVPLLKKAKIHSLILFPQSLRVATEAWMARIPERIGKAGHSRRLLLTSLLKPLVFDGTNTHQKYDYLSLIEQITGISDELLPELKNDLDPKKLNQITIFPGAEYGPAKQWIADRYVQVAIELQKKTGYEILFCGAEKDRSLCEELSKQVKGSHSLAGKTSLSDLMKLLRQTQLLIGNDSGAMHLAALLRTPAVALFGSTEPKLTGPMSDSVHVLREQVVCSPCFLRTCPLDFACMKKISVDQVLSSALQLIFRQNEK